jgi:hypothetical protein
MRMIKTFFHQLIDEITVVTTTLFRIMIPIIVLIKVVEELGGIVYLSAALAPVMAWVGLPPELGLVWAATLLTNIYAGMIVLLNLDLPLTVAQATILGSMMLLAHALPIEGAIAKKAGASLVVTLLLRVGGSLFFAWLLHISYQATGYLAQPAVILWQPEATATVGYLGWLLDQLQNFIVIFLVIAVLLFTLKVLKLLGIEQLMAYLLRPFLRLLGISREATNLTIIGVTLGLSFGGGLLINEAKRGHIPPRDVFVAMMLLNLLHSLIEDTLLILLIGADFYAIFWGRLVFSVVIIALIAAAVRRLDQRFCEKYLYHSVADMQR